MAIWLSNTTSTLERLSQMSKPTVQREWKRAKYTPSKLSLQLERGRCTMTWNAPITWNNLTTTNTIPSNHKNQTNYSSTLTKTTATWHFVGAGWTKILATTTSLRWKNWLPRGLWRNTPLYVIQRGPMLPNMSIQYTWETKERKS